MPSTQAAWPSRSSRTSAAQVSSRAGAQHSARDPAAAQRLKPAAWSAACGTGQPGEATGTAVDVHEAGSGTDVFSVRACPVCALLGTAQSMLLLSEPGSSRLLPRAEPQAAAGWACFGAARWWQQHPERAALPCAPWAIPALPLLRATLPVGSAQLLRPKAASLLRTGL